MTVKKFGGELYFICRVTFMKRILCPRNPVTEAGAEKVGLGFYFDAFFSVDLVVISRKDVIVAIPLVS